MCGISGIFRIASVVTGDDKSLVESMNRIHADRGPDNSNTWMDEHVVLGHTRLAIMDPGNTSANQPYNTENWVISFNGEIYNFRYLAELLKNQGIELETNSDTEVLAKAIEFFGLDEAINKLNGMFAIAAYEKKACTLHLVKDRLGIKPIYYYYNRKEGVLVFSSTPAAIAKTLNSSWDLDLEGLYSYFYLGAPVGPYTLFKGINRMLPAQQISLSVEDGLEKNIYWRPGLREGDIEEQVISSMRIQKESHVPSAVFLSGGIDSSVTATVLEDVTCFHLQSPELKYAEYVTNRLEVELKVRRFEEAHDFDSVLRSYCKSSGEVSASSPIPFMVSELIADSGFKVAFSANGADELFLGYPRTTTPELKPENFPAVFYEQYSEESAERQIYHIFRDPDSFKTRFEPDGKQSLFEQYGITRLDVGFSESAQSRWFELMSYVAYDLNPTLDFASMACSLEVRVPFLDHELVEHALSLDANEIISSDYGRKMPLKKLLRRFGYNPVLWSRPKIGFSIPPEVMQTRERTMRASLKKLNKRELLRLGKSNKYAARDYQYLSSAAHAFSVWCEEWIDTGLVRIP